MTLLNTFRKTTLNSRGFSLLEITITVGIIALLATIVLANTLFARDKARDTKRIADVTSMGRLLTLGCYKPNGGITEMDLFDLAAELVSENPKYANYLKQIPQDPKTGDSVKTNYRYIVTEDGKKCALYANLELEDAEVTLSLLTNPTPGGGQGVLQGSTIGPNGTSIYYQISN